MSAKRLRGKIVSDKMQKTVVVSLDMRTSHPIYGKVLTNTKRFKARNEIDAKLGDSVVIEECRPLSKEVTWKVVEVLKK